MGSMPTLEWPEPPTIQEEAASAGRTGAIVVLGSCMAILGAFRLVCALVEYAHPFREAAGSGPVSSRGWGALFHDPTPVSLLIGAWPLVLGLALRRTRWPELIKAGALTFLVLSIGGVLAVAADWNQTPVRSIAIGSFHVPRSVLGRPGTSGMAAGLAGAVQLLLEFAAAAWALVLAIRLHDDGGRLADRPVAARRSLFGRLAVLASVVFLLLTIRLPAWSTYLEILTQSQWIRDFILRDDFGRVRTSRPSPSAESVWASEARVLFRSGAQAWGEGKYSVSADNYARLAALLDAVPAAKMSAGERRLAAECLNNWAWLLSTCPEKGLRNYADAVRYARRALELEPKDGNTWNTLGVAYFRLEAWDDALSALYRSMELRDEGDSADWFFLAMIHQRLGRKERAREWYDKAVRWSHRYRPGDEELYRFDVEAAEALGLPKPEWRPRPPAQLDQDPRSVPPYVPPYPRGFRVRSQLMPSAGGPRPR